MAHRLPRPEPFRVHLLRSPLWAAHLLDVLDERRAGALTPIDALLLERSHPPEVLVLARTLAVVQPIAFFLLLALYASRHVQEAC